MPPTTSRVAAAVTVLALLGGCATGGAGWTTLVSGNQGLDNFDRVGEGRWNGADGALQGAMLGKDAAYLVTKLPYKDFMLRAEFWVSEDANSGIFFRCQNPKVITDESCYEANVFDQRPDPTYGTGAIVKVAKLSAPMMKAGGQWNTYEISARGTRLVLVLNGIKTVDIDDARFASGPIALQWGRGTIKFRKVEIKPL